MENIGKIQTITTDKGFIYHQLMVWSAKDDGKAYETILLTPKDLEKVRTRAMKYTDLQLADPVFPVELSIWGRLKAVFFPPRPIC